MTSIPARTSVAKVRLAVTRDAAGNVTIEQKNGDPNTTGWNVGPLDVRAIASGTDWKLQVQTGVTVADDPTICTIECWSRELTSQAWAGDDDIVFYEPDAEAIPAPTEAQVRAAGAAFTATFDVNGQTVSDCAGVTRTSADLTLSTVTTGDIDILSAGGVSINADGGACSIDGGANALNLLGNAITIDGSTVAIDSGGTFTTTAAGTYTITANGADKLYLGYAQSQMYGGPSGLSLWQGGSQRYNHTDSVTTLGATNIDSVIQGQTTSVRSTGAIAFRPNAVASDLLTLTDGAGIPTFTSGYFQLTTTTGSVGITATNGVSIASGTTASMSGPTGVSMTGSTALIQGTTYVLLHASGGAPIYLRSSAGIIYHTDNTEVQRIVERFAADVAIAATPSVYTTLLTIAVSGAAGGRPKTIRGVMHAWSAAGATVRQSFEVTMRPDGGTGAMVGTATIDSAEGDTLGTLEIDVSSGCRFRFLADASLAAALTACITDLEMS